jgi:hypothetical protein
VLLVLFPAVAAFPLLLVVIVYDLQLLVASVTTIACVTALLASLLLLASLMLLEFPL